MLGMQGCAHSIRVCGFNSQCPGKTFFWKNIGMKRIMVWIIFTELKRKTKKLTLILLFSVIMSNL